MVAEAGRSVGGTLRGRWPPGRTAAKQSGVFGLSFGEVILLVLLTLVVVGPRELPSMMRSLGRTLSRMRRMTTQLREQSGIDEILKAEGIDRELQELRKLAQGRLLDVNLDDVLEENVPPPPRWREYPPGGVDVFGALPEEAHPYFPTPEIVAATPAALPAPQVVAATPAALPAPQVVAATPAALPAPQVVAASLPAPQVVAATPAALPAPEAVAAAPAALLAPEAVAATPAALLAPEAVAATPAALPAPEAVADPPVETVAAHESPLTSEAATHDEPVASEVAPREETDAAPAIPSPDEAPSSTNDDALPTAAAPDETLDPASLDAFRPPSTLVPAAPDTFAPVEVPAPDALRAFAAEGSETHDAPRVSSVGAPTPHDAPRVSSVGAPPPHDAPRISDVGAPPPHDTLRISDVGAASPHDAKAPEGTSPAAASGAETAPGAALLGGAPDPALLELPKGAGSASRTLPGLGISAKSFGIAIASTPEPDAAGRVTRGSTRPAPADATPAADEPAGPASEEGRRG